MIVVEPCAYKTGTRVYAEKLCKALEEQQVKVIGVFEKEQPSTRLSFMFRFFCLYLEVWKLQRRQGCPILFVSVEPTIFPILNLIFPFSSKCYVKFGGYELRKSEISRAKNIIVFVRSILWRIVPNSIKIAETKYVYYLLQSHKIKNVKEIFHPVDYKTGIFFPNMKKIPKKLLYFGHRPLDDKNTKLVLDLARHRPEFEICIAGYEQNLNVHNFILEYLHNYKIKNVSYQNSAVSERQKANLFKECSFVLLPYRRNYDGGSGVLFDALKFGSRVVASNVSEFHDLLAGTGLGVIFEPDDLKSFSEALDLIHKSIISDQEYDDARNMILESRSFGKFVSRLLEDD